MRIFGDPDRTKRWLQTAGMKEGEVIESKMLSRQIERAQRKVEAYNFDLRKNLLEYDDVANDQRKVIYQQRTELMAAEDISDSVSGIRAEVVNNIIDQFVPRESPEEEWNLDGLREAIARDFVTDIDPKGWLEADDETGRGRACATASSRPWKTPTMAKVESVGAPVMRHLEKAVMLQELDRHWREHLAAMDYLRQGIHLRAYAQKNPKQEYKREAFELFGALLDRIKHDTISLLSRLQVRTEAEIEEQERERERQLARKLQIAARRRPVGAVERRGRRRPRHRAPAGGLRTAGGVVRRWAGTAGIGPAGAARSCARAARSVATSRARAARARSTSTATASSRAKREREICSSRRRRRPVRHPAAS